MRQQRQGRRQQRVLGLVHDVAARPADRPRLAVGGPEDQEHTGLARHPHRPDHDGRRRPVDPERAGQRLRAAAAQHRVDQVGDRPTVEQRQVGAGRAEGAGPGVGPDGAVRGPGQAVDRFRSRLHRRDEHGRGRVAGRTG
jgi:hypothetical protein